MIAIIPIEPVSDAHGALIVEAFSRHFIDRGGQQVGDGYGDGYGSGDGSGDGWGDGYGDGYGDGWGNGWGGKCPEDWQEE